MAKDITPPKKPKPSPAPAPAVQNTAERSKYFIEDLDKRLDDEQVVTALIFIVDPKSKDPIIYARGNNYSLAKSATYLARITKSKLDEELSL